MNNVTCVITTLDNLRTLKSQISILRHEPISKIVVVNNGSIDGTEKWLNSQPELTVVHRKNNGAGPGRNSGLNLVGECNYILMLDGGIRPLIGGTQRMLDYLQEHKDADVIGVEIPDFETNEELAWRRWPHPIKHTYQNTRLSHTAYCLARYKAFDGLRFCEEGPFGEPGWGADDDEMMCQWLENGIKLHVICCQCNNRKKPCTGVHPYRNASGSFRRLFQETGIWPNQYGSCYEQRLVWLQQNWGKYSHGVQWGEPEKSIFIECTDLESTIKQIKAAHDKMRENRFDGKFSYIWHPYEVVVKNPTEEFLAWAAPRRLRQHHGDTIVVNGEIVRRNSDNEELWTGDFKTDG